MLQHLRERLHAEKDELSCVLQRLQNLLCPTGPGDSATAQELQLPSFEVDLDTVLLGNMVSSVAFGEAAKSVLFFHVVRCASNQQARACCCRGRGWFPIYRCSHCSTPCATCRCESEGDHCGLLQHRHMPIIFVHVVDRQGLPGAPISPQHRLAF